MEKGQCKARWESPENPPKYDTQIGGKPFACILISSQGQVFAGDYTDGEWFILGAVKVEERLIDGWCHYPDAVKKRKAVKK